MDRPNEVDDRPLLRRNRSNTRPSGRASVLEPARKRPRRAACGVRLERSETRPGPGAAGHGGRALRRNDAEAQLRTPHTVS